MARDNFSKWLEPHEGDDTDVVLVGHSMGGLLAAEVILMVSTYFSTFLTVSCYIVAMVPVQTKIVLSDKS